MLSKSRFARRPRRASSFGFGWWAVVMLMVGSVAVGQSKAGQNGVGQNGAGQNGVGQNKESQAQGKAVAGASRGKYIVESVAMCGQCHSPRNAEGDPDRYHWLQGAAVPWEPTKRDPNWPLTAPRIGGTPLPASDEDMVKLLTTGVWITGEHLRPPMPQFRMERGDAEAVVAYLKSLNAQP